LCRVDTVYIGLQFHKARVKQALQLQQIPITTAGKLATDRCKSFDPVAAVVTWLQTFCRLVIISFNMLENIQMSNLLQPFTDAHKST
jgi:hypothetical protein